MGWWQSLPSALSTETLVYLFLIILYLVCLYCKTIIIIRIILIIIIIIIDEVPRSDGLKCVTACWLLLTHLAIYRFINFDAGSSSPPPSLNVHLQVKFYSRHSDARLLPCSWIGCMSLCGITNPTTYKTTFET